MSIYVNIEKKIGSFHLKTRFEAGNETLSLLGASGCGKSMTLRCIAGIEKPDSGSIVLDGITLFDSEKGINLSPQERHTGLMVQNYALFPNMTVIQNIYTGAKREKNKTKREEAVMRIMDSFGITELASHYPHQLSGGQQQRVALARILVSDPKILLLDEPFSALDSHLRFRLEREVREVIRSFGKTVLLVSHDRDEVYRMADRIVIMDQGKIVDYGDKKTIFNSPKTSTSAMLTGCKNISAIRKLTDNRILAVDWGMELTVDSPIGNASFVGIRMHHINPGEGKNAVHCKIIEEIENPFSYVIMLSPVAGEGAIPVGWETEKPVWEALRREEITVNLPPESLYLLEEV